MTQFSSQGERIVDVVLASRPQSQRSRFFVAFVVAVAVHALLGLLAFRVEPSLESWSADLAVRVHAELSREEVVEIPPALPSVVASKSEEDAPAPVGPQDTLAPRPRSARAPSGVPAPERAAALAEAEDPNQPVDFTAEALVTGVSAAYAGGATVAGGRGGEPSRTGDAPPSGPQTAASPAAGSGRSRPARLSGEQWRCPWPSEADDQHIHEQSAVVRVAVRADGSVESAAVVRDPGYGFGAAAVACAMSARFVPARDPAGRPVRTESLPIRVRFTR